MDKLLSLEETAEFLNLAKITVYKLVSAKKIPYVKLNRRVLFRTAQLEEWIDEKTISPLKTKQTPPLR